MRKEVNMRLIILTIVLFVGNTIVFAQQPSETPPPPSEPPTLTIPEVKEMTLGNGLKVVVVRKRGLPLVTTSLLIKKGSNAEDESKAGLASMTANTLIKGTEYRTATDIAEQIDFLGGSLNSRSGRESSIVNLNVLKDKLPRALSIMSDSVIRPTFPAKEVNLLKKQTLDGFNVSLKQPGALLSYVSSRYAFDEHLAGGTPQTIKRIRQRDLFNFHRENYQPKKSVLIFTGDISDKQAFRYAKLFFGGWKNQPKPKNKRRVLAMRLNSPPILGARDSGEKSPAKRSIVDKILVLDLPDSGQAAVGYVKKVYIGRIECYSVSEQSNECGSSVIYHPSAVLNSILGGGYSARLNQEIRLKRGLSYGARSGFNWRAWDSNFSATTQTKNESAGEVAELIKIEIEKLANDSIDNSELIPRKAVLTGGFGRGLQTNNGLAARLRELYLYDIATNELNSYMSRIVKVTDAEIQEFASANLLNGDIIIVGDSKMFMDDLKKRFPTKKIEVMKANKVNLNSTTLR